LHDLLLSLVVSPPLTEYDDWFQDLARHGRAAVADLQEGRLWYAVERRPEVEALLAGDPEGTAAVDVIRGHLDGLGPVTTGDLAGITGLAQGAVRVALAQLEQEGFVLQGRFDPAIDDQQWCARRLLARIHIYTQKRLRREIEPVTAQDLMRFLLRWQHVAAGSQRHGHAGLVSVIEQLQGFELPAGTWEGQVLPARVESYRQDWLDQLCHGGELVWGRLKIRDNGESGGAPAAPGATITSRATPITLMLRADLPWLLQAARGEASASEPVAGASHDIIEALRQHGALFLPELARAAGRLPAEVETALWDGVARGLLTADGFAALRALLAGRQVAARRGWQPRRGLRHGAGGAGRGVGHAAGGGRWSLLPPADSIDSRDALAEAAAEQLLARWGVVFRDLTARETLALPWRDILWALRRMEARGTVRGGRFVTGFVGEQYALPEAVEQLRAVRRAARGGEVVRISATDPLNLVGIVTPGPRIPAVRTNSVTYIDGLPADLAAAAL